MADRLNIIVFGATGFTGKFTLPYVHKFAKADGRNLTWGVAGRSEEKLKEVLAETSNRIGKDLSSIPIIIANVNDEESLKQMADRARVVINCCGPYQLYGEVVVKACIESGTHHVDVSGEPMFMEGMQLKYHKAAREKGVYIVSGCGVDSIPADLGICFLEKNFAGTLNSVETYMECKVEGDPPSGPLVHYGTWASAISFMGTFFQLLALRRKLYPNPLPKFQPRLAMKYLLHRVESNWAMLFLGADRDVINRSQRYFYEHERKRPIQVQCYFLVDSLIKAFMFILFGFRTATLAQFQFGRNLLLRHPKCFSNGIFSHEDPSEDVLERQNFSLTLKGEGWSERLADVEDQYKTPPNKEIVGRLCAKNPAYGFTCIALALSALMIVTEPQKLPRKGGVYTTAAAFSKTSLIEQLQKNGVVLEIISRRDL